jgi:hypothetical protein
VLHHKQKCENICTLNWSKQMLSRGGEGHITLLLESGYAELFPPVLQRWAK